MRRLNENEIFCFEKILDCNDFYRIISFSAYEQLKQSENVYKYDVANSCKIIFNPHRIVFFINEYDEGLEHYFDYELIDLEIPVSVAIEYKKAFVEFFKKANL